MLGFLVKRFLSCIFLVIFITFVTFALMKVSGDPLADLKLNPQISEERIQAEVHRLGLDKGVLEQYFTWFGNIIKGDFGLSQNNQRVVDLIRPALFNTLILNLAALFLTWAIAIPLGIIAAVNKDTWIDNSLRFVMSVFMSIPSFVLAIIMLLFALSTGLFPIGGLTSTFYDELNPLAKLLDLLRHLFLPVFILTIGGLVALQRQMRGNLLDVLSANYMSAARAKGLSETKVIYKHALRNAINPLVTILGYEFSNLFAGSALTEMVLSYPGLGYLTLEAARKLDINLVLANLLLGALMLVLGNLLADLLLLKVDPRMRGAQLE